MHTIRGVKHGNFHHVDVVSAQLFLDELMEDSQLSYEVPNIGEWYIDVAIQISDDRQGCLQWITSAHYAVIEQAMRITHEHAERISDINSSKYSRDHASHLTAISGFRATPGVQAEGPFEVAYIQAYTTDKSVVYNIDGAHHAKFLTLAEAMGTIQPPTMVNGLYDIYAAALRANSSSARVEVRVPFAFATAVLVEFDPLVLRDCLCSFTREEWW